MIDKKKIEEAANNYANSNWISDDCYNACEDGFVSGVNWLLNNLWHDARDDMPYHNAVCLCYDNLYEQYRVLRYDDINKYWSDTIIDVREPIGEYRITRWLYIDDLIKK